MSASSSQPPQPSQPTPQGNPRNPPLTPFARDALAEASRSFNRDLTAVAQVVARNCGSDVVAVPHVGEALSALRHAGLRRLKGWWERPDLKVGVGGILVGVGPTIASVAKDVIESYGAIKDYPVSMWLFMIALPFVICLAGVGLAVWGWTQNDGHPLG